MPEGSVETVRRIYDAWGVGDFSAGLDDLDPHVTFVVRAAFPARDVLVGPEAISRYMRDFLTQFEPGSHKIKATRLEASRDTVIAEVAQHGKGRASGIEVDLSFFMLFTFRGPTIVRIESVMDQAEALEAVGLPK